MIDTALIRSEIKKTFAKMNEAVVRDRYGVAYVPAEVLGLEGVIDRLLAEVDKEQVINAELREELRERDRWFQNQLAAVYR